MMTSEKKETARTETERNNQEQLNKWADNWMAALRKAADGTRTKRRGLLLTNGLSKYDE